MTGELILVAALVAAAVGYLLRKLLLRKKGACDQCAIHQAVEDRQRKAERASGSSGQPW